MKLIVGQHAGFCYGVRRAVERASECAAEKLPCATLGPIIHNPQEVERLAREGIRCITTPEEAYPGETIMIRSHGVSPTLIRRIEALGLPMIDLTCPHVAYIQQLVSKAEDGRSVVIIGEADHPEVQGIAGWASAPVVVLATSAEAASAALPARALVVAQTTLREETFESVLEVLRSRIPDLQVFRTICAATGQRQREAEQLSAKADVTVVVGGHNSSNTRKLYETCRQRCKRTYLIETPEHLTGGSIGKDDVVAVTAGASTPQWLLERVCRRIREISGC